MDKKTKFKIDYARAYHEYMTFSRGRTMKQFCEDEGYDYKKMQRYGRDAFGSKHMNLGEPKTNESDTGFTQLIQSDDVNAQSTELDQEPILQSGTGESPQVNDISFIKVQFRDGLTLSMSNVSIERMVALLQNVSVV